MNLLRRWDSRPARLLALTYPTLVILGVVPRLTWLFPVLCLVMLFAVGELWLRALVGEAVTPIARIGLGAAAGLVSLPLVAIVLYLLSVPIRAGSLAVALAVLATILGGFALLRDRLAPTPADPRLLGTYLAVGLPAAAALVIAAVAVLAYDRPPHPQQPGYTSIALAGWAAGIDSPVPIPVHGIDVPIRISTAGAPPSVSALRVWVGPTPYGRTEFLPIAADTTRSIDVHVPAPPDGCLHRILITVDVASTVFYGRGPTAC